MVVQRSWRCDRLSRPVGRVALVGAALASAIVASACANLDTQGMGAQGKPESEVAAAAGFDGVSKPTAASAVAPAPSASKDPKTALAHARSLKKAGRPKEAFAALEAAAEASPDNRALLVERGLIALEIGQVTEAQLLLARSNELKPKDWRVLSGLGIAASSQGQQKDAQKYFRSALEVSPDNPAVLNNLAVSYLLERKVEQAEATLRRANRTKSAEQKARVAQNLALANAIRSEQRGADETPALASGDAQARPMEPPPMGLTGGGLATVRADAKAASGR